MGLSQLLTQPEGLVGHEVKKIKKIKARRAKQIERKLKKEE